MPAGAPLAVPFHNDLARSLPDEHRPRPRRFTVRHWDPDARELTIDFVAHGDVGYAGSWAQRAAPGDRLQFRGPGGGYSPRPDADWHLLIGDESALPAISASVESLPASARVVAMIVVGALRGVVTQILAEPDRFDLDALAVELRRQIISPLLFDSDG